ncbi:hypothetical protein [Streptomyces syringium]|uniref:Lipoprotein n=1 Tax=Streptomyces syringium TaxID=76729 RepID=A0ABS4XYY8_9ACTN|nr:hypothetical protein [Streptomyces syringium]MBP2401733.1 hypothetical protein [Streptomyces syringium]
MHRMPAAAALAAVAMSAAVGCVALSPHAASPASDRSGFSRVTEPRMSPAPARESLGLVGPDGGPEGPDGSRSPSEAASGTPSASGPGQDRDGDADPDRSTEAEARAEDDADARSDARPSSSRAADPDRWDGPGRTEVRSPGAAPPARSAPGREPESAPAPAPREAPPSRHHVEQAPPPPQRSESRPAQQTPPRSGSNVCGLGESYGRWKKDDDASRICRQVYGR